ncbi:hypothetical protein LHYA1_G002521 [Lachnellula hyalina]|uniref:Uncharacterized protein n=1 Tax=Lachnellula hyalina TaxID=1316788 RepID=A0A8H8R9K8_9HELO|nr:uncharacterized protein LHYA1_G002521 [Lachnellula hyalina]TVY30083.1 hypothetical protein LHYA1_G002521 [Lachnellula hyalina]
MVVQRALSLGLGAWAVWSGIAMLTFDIIFAVCLNRNNSPVRVNVVAIVSSGLSGITVALLLMLLGRQIQYRSGSHIQDFGHGRLHTYLLAGLAGGFGVLSAVASSVVLVIMRSRVGDRPQRIINGPSHDLVTVWAVSLLSEGLFVICMVIFQRRDFQQQIQRYRASMSHTFPQMQATPRPQAPSMEGSIDHRREFSMESRRPRSGSDEMSSMRSSISQVVRPITSKTKLIQKNHKPSHRTTSIESSQRDASMDDSFDSWDTSSVDASARQAVELASPSAPRFLETIPASPTTSRSASPGFPLDLEPPKTRRRSRSYSPSYTERRTSSPIESRSEAHIHPLFRTDSPDPPPTTTPGTIVIAAPNAGQLLSDRISIRSVHRMRSGSLPSSPLVHSDSLDSIRNAMERQELEGLEENKRERSLTPPIPDFVLNGGSRNSLSGYHSRKKAQTGLGMVGEGLEA